MTPPLTPRRLLSAWRRGGAGARRRVAGGVAGRARQAGRSLAVAAAADVLLMLDAGVELQGGVAGNVTVLAARMLEHGLDRGEGRKRRWPGARFSAFARLCAGCPGCHGPAAEEGAPGEQPGKQDPPAPRLIHPGPFHP